MVRTAKTLALLLTICVLASAQGSGRKPVEGVWKVAEIVVTGADAATNSNPQPALWIFTQSHYSQVGVPGVGARKLFKNPTAPTSEEKTAGFDTFYGNSGTYEISGSTVTIHPMVARNPNFMAGGFSKYQFRLEGNVLWLTDKTPDSSFRIGDKVVPDSGAMSEERIKLVRLE